MAGQDRRRKLLCIANCQGPAVFGRFIGPGCRDFSERFQVLPFVQVHLLAADRGSWVAGLIEEADVIVAQPVVRHAVREVLFDSVREASARGKEMLSLPALHFDALFPTQGPRLWPGEPGYPFGAVEDVSIAAGFCAGLSAERTAERFHDFSPLGAEALAALVQKNIAEFETREAALGLSVPMSDFYAATWQDHRLHYVKSHPHAAVYAELAARLAAALGLESFDRAGTAASVGNDQFSLPISARVAELAQLRFQDDAGYGQFQNQRTPFAQIIERFFDFYRQRGVAAVRKAHAPNADFEKALDHFSS